MNLKKRTIYAFETTIMGSKSEREVELKWKPEFLEEIFEFIMKLSEKERVEEKPGEWFFYLAKYTLDKREKDPTHEDCIYGWFESVRIGFRTNLKQLSTMKTRPNPKAPDESEIMRTYFYFRLKDGLLLLDSYGNNVVTYKRVEAYLKNKAPTVFQKHNVYYLSFYHLISKGFLEQLQNFEVIRLAQIRLKVSSDAQYDTSDAIGSLQHMSQYTYSNYVDITMGRKNARKNGLMVNRLREILNKIIRNNQEVISGTIQGTRNDGGPSTLKLKGIEEKYPKNFEVDGAGEVLSEPIFAFMIDIGNNHY